MIYRICNHKPLLVVLYFLGVISILLFEDLRATMVDHFAQARSEMVITQLVSRGIIEREVLNSMNSVPRHLFVPSSLKEQAYDDTPLPIGCGQTISQPYIVALMAQEARLKPEHIILEVGGGCGYAAAVYSHLVKKVYSIELIPELALAAKKRLKNLGYANVIVFQSDGSIGLEEYAPFDAILVAAGTPAPPQRLKEQLIIGGCLLIPVGNQFNQKLIRITRLNQSHFQEENLGFVVFVQLKSIIDNIK